MQLLNLVGLNEQRWPEDLLTRSAMALVLLGILRASGYFGIAKISTSADTYTNNELFIERISRMATARPFVQRRLRA